MASRKIDPLFEEGRLLLPLGQVLLEALFGAELLVCKSVTNKTETAIACLAARFRF
jgi:hypothetical protein